MTGPSELGTSIIVQAVPDTIVQDGASQSLVTITARDQNGQPLRNVTLRAEIQVGGATTDFGSLSARTLVTDSNGRAGVTYTAPPAPAIFVDNGTIVSIAATPTGSDFANSTSKVAEIRLVPPGVIGAPPSPFRPEFAAPSPTVGDPASFSATVTDAAGADVRNQVVSFIWNFGDGKTGSGPNVQHTYTGAGNFGVSLTIIDFLGRTATAFHSLTVAPGQNPSANIQTSPSSPNTGQTVIFTATNVFVAAGHSIRNFSWDFGDGSPNAGGQSTSHAYAQNGNYTVILTLTDDAGRDGTATTSVNVGTGGPTAVATFSPSSPLVGTNISFDGSGSRAAAGRSIVSYSWNFDDGSPLGSGQRTSHAYGVAGTYQVRLTVTDNAGETGTTTVTVTVGGGTPTSLFTFSPTSPATSQSVIFDGSGSTAVGGRVITGYVWSFGDGTPTQTGQTTNHSYAVSGSYVVRLTVTDSASQTGTSTQSITVTSDPVASFTFSPPAPTAGSFVTFDGTSSSVGAGRTLSYSWNFGDPTSGSNTSTSQSPGHVFATAGSYTVTLTVTDSALKTNSTTRTVIVSP